MSTLDVEIMIAPKKRRCQRPEAPAPPRIPQITRLMALAIKFQDMIDRGEVRDYADMARLKPEALGILGEEHFQQLINAQGKTFRYKREKGIDTSGLPFVVEFAFGMTDDERLRGQHIGLNWSVPLSNPLQDNLFDLGDDGDAFGLAALFARHRIQEQDPVCMCLHLISPRFDFLDRGKGA